MRSRWFGLMIAALAAAVSVWAYPRLPETVATHWNLRGVPDGYSSRLTAAALMPLAMLGIVGLFTVLPKVDPRRENYARFIQSYWLIANAVVAFMLLAHVLVLANGLGYSVQIDRMLPAGVGLLFVVLGNYLTRVEPNWFVGIRTPWTLSSDKVWRKTHRTGGWLFVAAGIVMMLVAGLGSAGAFLPLFVGTLVVVAGIPVVQSYILWKRERHDRP